MLRRFHKQNPYEFHVALARSADSSADAISLALRFRAMARALVDLARQTSHFRHFLSAEHRLSPLEPGFALGMPRPGARRSKHLHQAYAILRRLVHWSLERPPDTS